MFGLTRTSAGNDEMSLSMSDAERITLDRVVPLLRAEGYEVIPEPSPHDLPSFLGEWHPDAIAIG